MASRVEKRTARAYLEYAREYEEEQHRGPGRDGETPVEVERLCHRCRIRRDDADGEVQHFETEHGPGDVAQPRRVRRDEGIPHAHGFDHGEQSRDDHVRQLDRGQAGDHHETHADSKALAIGGGSYAERGEVWLWHR